MIQTWSHIIWAHWPVDPGVVASLLPPGLTPETFDGAAWVGLIPFQMSELRLPGALSGLTSLVGVRAFGEVNVRTYVHGPDGRTGVWFLTLDADRLLAVITARLAFGLPYRQAANRLTVASEHGSERLTWTSRRRSDGATAVLEVTPEGAPPRPAAQGLERFLVERYSLYSWWHGHLLEGTLSHPSWRVRSARLDAVDTGTVAATGLLVDDAPHVLVGEPVEVRVHPFHRIRRQRKGVVDTEPDLGVDAGAGRHPGSGRP